MHGGGGQRSSYRFRGCTSLSLARSKRSRIVGPIGAGEHHMFSKINHVAIVSYDYAQLAQFYEAVFGMRTSAKTRVGIAVTVGDGYVGLNINPRRAGRAAGLDHFGIEVEDVETVFDRMRTSYPSVKWLQRPSNRPFAGITTHDPDGNVFDISQKDVRSQDESHLRLQGRQRNLSGDGARRGRRPLRRFGVVDQLHPSRLVPAAKDHGADRGRARTQPLFPDVPAVAEFA